MFRDLLEYHSLGKSMKEKITLGYIIPIKKSKNCKLFLLPEEKQIIHYNWFKEEIKDTANKLNDSDLTDSEYQVIPRFRYIHSSRTLYIPSNFSFDSMLITHIITELGEIENYDIINVEKTKGEDIMNKWNLKKIVIK